MSVLIKGMEMPENCMDCKIKQYDEYEDDCICPFSGVVCLSIGRQDACPLVEVPTPHGRLVEFIDVAVTCDDDTAEEINFGEALSAYLKMRSAPAVIEAEGEHERVGDRHGDAIGV